MAQQLQNSGLKIVGKRGPNLDAVERVTGQAKYVGDIEIAGMLVGRVLRTTHTHARIVSVDTSRAEAVPGVKAIITYKDAPKVPIWGARNLILNDRVRFKGEAVAAVAAVDEESADKALKLIRVEFEPLPFVMDPEDALKPGAPRLFEDGNLLGQPRVLTRGDVEKALASSDKVIEHMYHCQTSWSGGMEPRCNIALWENDRLTLYAATQAPGRVHTMLTQQFNLPDSKVRVIASYVGGGFGTKSAPHMDEGLTALLAKKARRPVKVQYSREEEIIDSNTRFETKMYCRVGVNKDMTIQALDVRAFINQGAYHTRLGGLGNHSTHLYKIPHLRTTQYRVHTNLPNTGPTRGVGDPQECFGLDSVMDEVAHEMGWDPMEFKLKNIKRNGDPVARGGAGREDGVMVNHALDRCIEQGASRIDWSRRPKVAGGQTGSKLRGIGLAITERGGGGGQAGASVKVYLDGSVVVFYASTDIGTGSKTTLSMIAAEALGLPLSSVRAVAGDTDMAPYDPGAFGNRVLQTTGAAVLDAAKKCQRDILETAGQLMMVSPDELELVDGVVRVKANGEMPRNDNAMTMKLGDVMQRRGRSVVNDGTNVQSQTGNRVERTSAAHFAEVEVDADTGRFTVLRYVAAHDCGQPINQTIVENQIEGGCIQGLALAIGEVMQFDRKTGGCLSGSFVDLKPPTALDIDPRGLEAIVVQNLGETGPYGAKGLGENPCHPGMAAIANAIYNATGVRLRQVPFTRAAILQGLAEKKNGQGRTV